MLLMASGLAWPMRPRQFHPGPVSSRPSVTTTGRWSDAILAGCLVEAYSQLQIDLRRRFPENPVLFVGLVNGCIGYTPPAELYDREVYQVWQTPFDRGCLETLTEAFADAIASLTAKK